MVNNSSVEAPSISEDLLTVFVGAPGNDDEEEVNDDENNGQAVIESCIHPIATSTTTTATTSSGITTTIASDPRGIPEAGQLAEILMRLTGLAVSAVRVKKIKALCNALDDYNKKATEVHLKSQKPCLKGCLCSQKQTGHTTRDQMRKYILTYNIMLCMCYTI